MEHDLKQDAQPNDLRWFIIGIGHDWKRRPTLILEQSTTGARARIDDYTQAEIDAVSTYTPSGEYIFCGERRHWTDEAKLIHDNVHFEEYAARGPGGATL